MALIFFNIFFCWWLYWWFTILLLMEEILHHLRYVHTLVEKKEDSPYTMSSTNHGLISMKYNMYIIYIYIQGNARSCLWSYDISQVLASKKNTFVDSNFHSSNHQSGENARISGAASKPNSLILSCLSMSPNRSNPGKHIEKALVKTP